MIGLSARHIVQKIFEFVFKIWAAYIEPSVGNLSIHEGNITIRFFFRQSRPNGVAHGNQKPENKGYLQKISWLTDDETAEVLRVHFNPVFRQNYNEHP